MMMASPHHHHRKKKEKEIGRVSPLLCIYTDCWPMIQKERKKKKNSCTDARGAKSKRRTSTIYIYSEKKNKKERKNRYWNILEMDPRSSAAADLLLLPFQKVREILGGVRAQIEKRREKKIEDAYSIFFLPIWNDTKEREEKKKK